MPLAARVGDLTSHGIPLAPGPGAATVLIGGMPAWRISDMHVCPLMNGVVPHVGGTVPIGSTSVFICGLPAVRMGDTVVEGGGGPNAIVSGCTSVIIG